MKWLISNGADINARSQYDESILSLAVAAAPMHIIRFLLRHRADCSRGNVLHTLAHRKDQLEGAGLVETLVRRGADVNGHRYDNSVAFRWKAFHKLLTPLHECCYAGNVPVAKALLERGADPNRQMLQTRVLVDPTALQQACRDGNTALVELFEKSERTESDEERGSPLDSMHNSRM